MAAEPISPLSRPRCSLLSPDRPWTHSSPRCRSHTHTHTNTHTHTHTHTHKHIHTHMKTLGKCASPMLIGTGSNMNTGKRVGTPDTHKNTQPHTPHTHTHTHRH